MYIFGYPKEITLMCMGQITESDYSRSHPERCGQGYYGMTCFVFHLLVYDSYTRIRSCDLKRLYIDSHQQLESLRTFIKARNNQGSYLILTKY